jgi:hypothetical protein
VVRPHVYALIAFALAAVAFTWPLATHLTTDLTGPPGGDTGVYLWNLWVFRHELLQNGHLPFLTSQIFSLDSPAADLSLHNYTVFADLVALPVVPLVGLVGAFNLVYLLNMTLAAYAMFVLARHETQRAAEAWLAGGLFAFSAPLIARGTAHFSLVAAAPLPAFLFLLARAYATERPGWAVAAGLAVAWAGISDPYYGVYCLLAAACFVAWRLLDVHVRPQPPERRRRRVVGVLDVLVLCLGGFAVGTVIRGGSRFDILGVRVALVTLYTPMLLLTTFLVIRLLLWLRPQWTLRPGWRPARMAKVLVTTGVTGLIALSPVLYALALRIRAGRYVSAPVSWRSTPPGVDALAFFMPNPNHPLFGGPWREWLAGRPGGFTDNVASVPLLALAVILLAAATRLHRVSRFWATFTAVFATLALGPFIVVGGTNTGIPTPWTVLRFLPVIGSARMPGRFTVLVLVGVAVLFAHALVAIGHEYPRYRRLILATVGLGLLAELAPMPRPLYAAAAPRIYHTIAADPRPVRVLRLPLGIRDGLSSAGNASAATQYYQTVHGKAIVGGYLSRVSQHRVRAYRGHPVLGALLSLSEGRALSPDQVRRAYARRDAFLGRSCLGYVVVDTVSASPTLTAFAADLLDLVRLDEDRGHVLYRPRRAGCASPPGR